MGIVHTHNNPTREAMRHAKQPGKNLEVKSRRVYASQPKPADRWSCLTYVLPDHVRYDDEQQDWVSDDPDFDRDYLMDQLVHVEEYATSKTKAMALAKRMIRETGERNYDGIVRCHHMSATLTNFQEYSGGRSA